MVVCLVDCPFVINLQYTFLLIFRQSTIFAYYFKIFYHRISLRSVMVLNGTMIVIKNSHKFFSSHYQDDDGVVEVSLKLSIACAHQEK